MEPSTIPAALRQRRVSDGPDETREIGRAIGMAAKPGTVVALIGPLGAGKTQLAKGVAEGLDVTGTVNSPTFILMNEHVGRLRFYHVDAYRLADSAEAPAAGLLDERQADGVVVIEWADRLDGWLPSERLEIRLETPPDAPMRRVFEVMAIGAAHESLAIEAFGRS